MLIGSVVALLGAAGALAQIPTSPVPGAVPLPAGLNLSLPFEAGERVVFPVGYNAVPVDHLRTNITTGVNKYYAFDAAIFANPANAVILATADGVVRASGPSGGCDGNRVIIEHTPYNIWSLTGLLESIPAGIVVGQPVQRGDRLGVVTAVAPSGCGHLNNRIHFSVHSAPTLTSGELIGGRSVVPEPIDGFVQLNFGGAISYPSKNTPTAPSTTGTTAVSTTGTTGFTTGCDVIFAITTATNLLNAQSSSAGIIAQLAIGDEVVHLNYGRPSSPTSYDLVRYNGQQGFVLRGDMAYLKQECPVSTSGSGASTASTGGDDASFAASAMPSVVIVGGAGAAVIALR